MCTMIFGALGSVSIISVRRAKLYKCMTVEQPLFLDRLIGDEIATEEEDNAAATLWDLNAADHMSTSCS